MLNEREEFRAYTEQPIYKAVAKRDTLYMGRFTMGMLLDFEGLARVLTIVARGYLFHGRDSSLVESPRTRIEYARRALSAWCSVPDKERASPKEGWQYETDFKDLSGEFPELVDEHGAGWFCRHAHGIARFLKENPEKVNKSAYVKADIIEKKFDGAWRKKVVQYQVPLFSPGTNGAWILRFDDVLADALELGPLRSHEATLPEAVLEQIDKLIPKKVPREAICMLIAYYLDNKPDDSDWVVLPVTNFDAYFGSTMFSKKWLPAIPEMLIVRERERMGVARYRCGTGITLC